MKDKKLLTKAIRNAGKVLNMNTLSINKISGKLKINRFNLPAGRQECGTQHIQAVGVH